MIKDPGLQWPSPFPYDVLAPAGVTPDTTHEEMQDVSFALMEHGLMGTETQTAWHELRSVEQRLLIDLVLFDADPAAEIPALLAALAEEPADAQEPPQVRECLTLRRADFDGLADELRPLEAQAPAIPAVAELERVEPPALLDEFLTFDS
ncbi:hypothetical protein SRB5_27280 [Streptomyces sp. RB5]|uniref:Uncharacterized protein n=1 Tax=Streptomyces smaragdinus TaxID=2585196 RepID=A0A7K0CHY5_9ACTN|nr:hypothetical protein [Streptomyces smaragdinus]MQY12592.1 hypothetical protein [Streptomyces smaragdinus]